jgi:tRNA(Ile)-lysidine synthetase-like protein
LFQQQRHHLYSSQQKEQEDSTSSSTTAETMKMMTTRTTAYHKEGEEEEETSSHDNDHHSQKRRRRRRQSTKPPPSTSSSLPNSIDDHIDQVISLTDTKRQLKQPHHLHIVVSVSGGCDSMALLHSTIEYVQRFSGTTTGTVHVVHFHHRQRPTEADRDCQFVLDVVEKYDTAGIDIRFHLEDWKDHTATTSTDNRPIPFSQDGARRWRRTKLLEYTKAVLSTSTENTTPTTTTATNPVVAIIMTAHHRDDNDESILLKLIRGVHILNIKGMDSITKMDAEREESSSSSSNNNNQHIYLVRPFLLYEKQDLINYLNDNGYEWREDASNRSDKYLRNRIRNELLPLLNDMTDQNLRKRLSALQKQACDVRNDTKPRVQDYYDAKMMNQQRDSDQLWIIDEDPTTKPSRLIYSQALYQWMTNQIVSQTLQNEESTTLSTLSTVSSSSHQQQQTYVSYETLERIMNQLEQHPNRQQWTIEIGNNINLIRQGNVLKIGRPVEDQKQKENYQDGIINMVSWKWSLTTATKELRDDNSNTVQILLPYGMLGSDITFFSSTLGDATNDLSESDEVDNSQSPSFLNQFVPPWKNSPVKIRQFLRGQNVPLHQRDDIPLLILRTKGRSIAPTTNNEMAQYQVVAVQVEPSKWIVSKEFIRATDNDEDDNGRANITLSIAQTEGE